MSKGAWIVGALVGAGLVTLIGWKVVDKQNADADLKKSQAARLKAPASVVLAKAGPKVISDIIESVGTVESPTTVKLSAKVAGRINRLLVREGSVVKSGDLLVEIDPGDLRAAVLQQEAAVAEANSRLAQAKATQGSTDVQITAAIEQQSAQVQSANADASQVEKNFDVQLAAARSAVVDAEAKLRSANSQINTSESDLSAAKANLENAQSKLARITALYKQGFIAAQDVDDAKTTVRVQENAVQSATSRLRASQAASESAKAQLAVAQGQVSILERKGKADITSANARANQARSSLKSATSNRSQSRAYAENIAALQSAVHVAVAQLAQARAKVSDTILRSNIDGVVTTKSLDEGSLATAGQPILTIQYLRTVFVTAGIPIDLSANVHVGQVAEIAFEGMAGKVQAPIAEINPAADTQTRQFTVRFKLDNPKGTFKPGMFAHVFLKVRETNAKVVVPREAIKSIKGENQVTVVDQENTAHVVNVTLGATNGDETEILEGVEPGDRVVILAYNAVKDGQKVAEASSKKEGDKKAGARKASGDRK